jgi:tight adherence protein C
MPLYVYFTAGLVAIALVVFVVNLFSLRTDTATSRANLARGATLRSARQVALSESARSRLLDPFFAGIAARAKALVSAEQVGRSARRLELAGLEQQGWTIERVLVVRVLAGLLGVTAALLLLSNEMSRNTVLQALIVAGMGIGGPIAWLDRKAEERQAAIEKRLPDVVDQLSVSVEAGLGFDAALANVVAGRTRRDPLTDELNRVMQDVQMGMTRPEAFEQLLARTDVADLRQFVSAVRQSAKHGLPISEVLQIQSAEMRDKRQGRIEERAASLPVKITFPLVFCILPALFVIVLGPAALDVASGL